MQLILPIFILSIINTLICQETWKLSDRVGNSIDLIEKEYFCLFPEIDEFRSASLTEQSTNGKPVLQVIHGNNNETKLDTAYYYSHIMILNDYIENFEFYLLNDCTDVLREMNGLIDIEAYEDRVDNWREFRDIHIQEIKTLNGTILRGSIIRTYADSLKLFINSEEYDWRNPGQNTMQFSIQEIDTIYCYDYESLGFGWGYLAGSTVAVLIVAIVDYNTFAAGLAALAGGLVGGITFSSINSSETYIDDIDVADLSIDRKMTYLLRYYDLVYEGPVIPLELRK